MGHNIPMQYIIIPDIHCPYHDPSYIAVVERLTRIIRKSGQLTGIVQLGDFVDFWQVSSYPKDPSRRETVVEDLDTYLEVVRRLCKAMGPGVWHQIEGNHEERLGRFVASHAAPIHQLVTSVEQYIKERFPKQVRFVWHPYKKWKSCRLGDCYLMHGYYYNQHVAMTHLAKYKRSTIFGHTHRLQYVSDGEHFAATLGPGSLEETTSHTPTPTGWSQAIGVLTVDRGVSSLQVVRVRDGRGWYGSQAI